jgi:hypothetical protein
MRAFILPFTLLALAACGGTSESGPPPGEPDASKDDSGPVAHEAGTEEAGAQEAGTVDAAAGCGGNISFDLAVDSSDPVYYEGPQPPWPAQNTCPGWLTIDSAGAALLLGRGDCDISCVASQPQVAAAKSLTWDGTYYPIDTSSQAPGPGNCETPACAPAGNYVATFCVASSLGEPSGEAPPTCKTVSFVWPPSTTNQVISETITPSPDGG